MCGWFERRGAWPGSLMVNPALPISLFECIPSGHVRMESAEVLQIEEILANVLGEPHQDGQLHIGHAVAIAHEKLVVRQMLVEELGGQS
mgnify:CR=1 FL=1